MTPLRPITTLLLLFTFVGCSRVKEAAKDTEPQPAGRRITGQIVGESTSPIIVSTSWSANGRQWDDDGNDLKLTTAAEISARWGNEGLMEAWPKTIAKADVKGRFEIRQDEPKHCVAYAMNEDQTLGAVGLLSPDSDEQMTLELKPLARVTGRVECDGRTPGWNNTNVFAANILSKPT